MNVLDIREMVRRFKLGQRNRQVARELMTDRRTVSKYRKLAEDVGWMARPDLPSPAEVESRLVMITNVPKAGPQSSVEPHRARVKDLRDLGVERMAIWQILKDEFRYAGSYSSVRRFVRTLEPPSTEACIRIETLPGVMVHRS
jgi:hypothetical protein